MAQSTNSDTERSAIWVFRSPRLTDLRRDSVRVWVSPDSGWNQTHVWAPEIRWVDGRFMRLEPPVHGRFDGTQGLFLGEDHWEGRPILVRFLWQKLGPERARWEQAFSEVRGSIWETNWIMDFTRAA